MKAKEREKEKKKFFFYSFIFKRADKQKTTGGGLVGPEGRQILPLIFQVITSRMEWVVGTDRTIKKRKTLKAGPKRKCQLFIVESHEKATRFHRRIDLVEENGVENLHFDDIA